MSFTTEYILSISPPTTLPGGLEKLSWAASSSMPAGDVFQVYLGSALAYSGAAPTCTVAVPPGQMQRVTIGSVDAADAATNYGDSLSPAPNRRIRISWQGGTFEGADIRGFFVFLSAAGQAVNLAGKPAADIAAFPGGSPVATGNFSWTSANLTSGTYQLAVVPYDTAGNRGTPQYATDTVSVPPLPPALNSLGGRLTYQAFDTGLAPGVLPTVTLNWLPSPG